MAPLGHAFMFWGLIVFVIGYVIFLGLGAGFGLFPIMSGSTFERTFFSIMEIVGILILLAMIGAVVKRYVVKPARLERHETTGEKVIQPILLAVIIAVVVLHYPSRGLRLCRG